MLTIIVVIGPLNKSKEVFIEDNTPLLLLIVSSFKLLIYKLKNKKLAKWYRFLILPIDILAIIMGMLFIIFFLLYLFLIIYVAITPDINVEVATYFPLQLMILFGFFWLVFLFDYVDKTFKTNKDHVFKLNAGFLTFIFLCLVIYSNKQEAGYIKSGNPKYFVSFELSDKVVQTDTTFVFLGKTKEYIFLRDLTKETNIIYPVSDIKRIDLMKANR